MRVERRGLLANRLGLAVSRYWPCSRGVVLIVLLDSLAWSIVFKTVPGESTRHRFHKPSFRRFLLRLIEPGLRLASLQCPCIVGLQTRLPRRDMPSNRVHLLKLLHVHITISPSFAPGLSHLPSSTTIQILSLSIFPCLSITLSYHLRFDASGFLTHTVHNLLRLHTEIRVRTEKLKVKAGR